VKVGAATEIGDEREESPRRRRAARDPCGSRRSIVAGGGVAFIRARQGLKDLKGDNHDQDAGIKIVLRALEEPARQIAANAGDEPSVVLNKIAEGKGNYGYNAATGEYGDMVESGVLDPTKVTRYAAAERRFGRGPDPHDRRNGRRDSERRVARRPCHGGMGGMAGWIL